MRLVVVGRDYGWQEAAAGRPFVGPSGKLLTRAMQQAGIDRSAPDVLVTNVVNKRPPRDEWGAHAPGDVEAGMDKLHQTLTLAAPKLIVALGEHALNAVRVGDPHFKPPKKQTITETRGYTFDSPDGRVLAAVHPAFILRTWHPWWATFCYDWQKAARTLRCDGVGRGGREHIVPDGTTCLSDLSVSDTLAVDIETTGSGAACRPVCIAFARDPRAGFAVRWNDANLPLIRMLLEYPAPKVFHNGQFDVTILERAGAPVAHWAHDTMLLWHSVEPLLAGKQDASGGSRSEKSLRFLASLLLDEPWWKSYNFESEEEQLLLCARDSRITLAVHQQLLTRLQGGTRDDPAQYGPRARAAGGAAPHDYGGARRNQDDQQAHPEEARSDPSIPGAPGHDEGPAPGGRGERRVHQA